MKNLNCTSDKEKRCGSKKYLNKFPIEGGWSRSTFRSLLGQTDVRTSADMINIYFSNIAASSAVTDDVTYYVMHRTF